MRRGSERYRVVNETRKLEEARHFLGRMRLAQAAHDEPVFRNELSAFLSAARTVLQYARDEAHFRGQQQWYEMAVGSDVVVRFMRDERNNNIHERPVSPGRVTGVDLTEQVGLRESITLILRDSEGRLITERHEDSPPPIPAAEVPTQVTTRFFFANWSGSEDVVGLAGRYLDVLDRLVAAGASHGILTP